MIIYLIANVVSPPIALGYFTPYSKEYYCVIRELSRINLHKLHVLKRHRCGNQIILIISFVAHEVS